MQVTLVLEANRSLHRGFFIVQLVKRVLCDSPTNHKTGEKKGDEKSALLRSLSSKISSF